VSARAIRGMQEEEPEPRGRGNEVLRLQIYLFPRRELRRTPRRQAPRSLREESNRPTDALQAPNTTQRAAAILRLTRKEPRCED